MANSEYNEDVHHSSFLQNQTVEDENRVRRNPMMKPGKPISCLSLEMQTLHDVFMAGHGISQNDPCVGFRPEPEAEYSWLSYDEVLAQSKAFASGLVKKGAQTNPDQFVGIFSQNRVEWKLTEQACNSYSMAIVPLYDTLGQEAIEHIVSLCELKIIVVDNEKKATTLLNCVNSGTFKLDLVVIMDEPSIKIRESAKSNEVELMTFKEVVELGKEEILDIVPPKPSDLHTICFTSGTTGLPKGAMLTHQNVVANLCGVLVLGKNDFLKFSKDDVHISYLPLAHVFERVMSAITYMHGGRVGFFQGDIKLLLSDVGALRPTIFPMVPRLINRMYDKIHQGVQASCVKSMLLNMAKNSKLEKLRQGIVTRDTWWDTLVFKKIQNLFGGRARICVTGAAPISNEVLNFLRVALGVNFSEGYGQTEATAAISVTMPGDFFSGSVGAPALCNEVKLADVPEMEYFAADGKGEVCAKGFNVFKGYYKNEAKTKEALDEDGWLHTGDIGMWTPNGALKIIDRKKHILKLSQGEYVAPEKIEQFLTKSTPVAQVYVHGNSLKSSLVSVVVPDPETVFNWVSSKGIKGDATLEALCNNPKVNELILKELKQVGGGNGLKGFEIPRKVHLSPEMFSVENNLLTPTFKSKRLQISKRYAEQIDTMYQDLD